MGKKIDELRQAQTSSRQREALLYALARRIREGFTAYLEAEPEAVKMYAGGSSAGAGTMFVLTVDRGSDNAMELPIAIHEQGGNFVLNFPGKELNRDDWPTVCPDHDEDLQPVYVTMFKFLKDKE
jgi:hypothetical protein